MKASLLPELRYKDNLRLLYNPIRKKYYVNQPEERVRLSELNRLLLEGFSRALIQTENRITHQLNNRFRCDIVVYNRNGDVEILVECKSPNIALSEATVKQSLRYNESLKAKEIRISNGLNCNRYIWQNSKYMPAPMPSIPTMGNDISYWQKGGFIGQKTAIQHQKLIQNELKEVSTFYWIDCPLFSANEFVYQECSNFFFPDLDTDNVWHTFMALPNGSTRKLVLLSHDKESTLMLVDIEEYIKAKTVFLFSNGLWEKRESLTTIERILTLQGGKDFLLYDLN